MACFQLRRRFVAQSLRHSVLTTLSVAVTAGLFANASRALSGTASIPFDECCLLVEHGNCGQSLLLADGTRVAIETLLDYPEHTWLQVSGTLTGYACANPCVPVSYQCLSIDEVRLCDEGINFCFGDGESGWCPCANMSGEGRGCTNTSGQGARFRTGGAAEVGRWMDLYLDGLPQGAPCVLVAGTVMDPLTFHDGLLCVGPPYRRLANFTAGADGCFETTVVLSTLASASVGQTHYYQLWYGDDAYSTCGQGSNFTNAVELEWIWGPAYD